MKSLGVKRQIPFLPRTFWNMPSTCSPLPDGAHNGRLLSSGNDWGSWCWLLCAVISVFSNSPFTIQRWKSIFTPSDLLQHCLRFERWHLNPRLCYRSIARCPNFWCCQWECSQHSEIWIAICLKKTPTLISRLQPTKTPSTSNFAEKLIQCFAAGKQSSFPI